MGKRGRKPSERKGYFYEKEERAIIDYINETDVDKKNKIFNTILYPALTKMIESIIRRYKLFVPDEEFEQNFRDTISYLLTKINHFKPEIIGYDIYEGPTENIDFVTIDKQEFDKKIRDRDVTDDDPEYVMVVESDFEDSYVVGYFKRATHHYKAYSYCGTVCKNYLMYKCSQYAKKRQRNTPYDEVFEEISNSQKFSTEEDDYSSIAARLIAKTADEIEAMIIHPEKDELTEDEIKVGKALINLMRNWEDVLPSDGSNKLQKSSILYYLREETMMTTKTVRDNMKKFKSVYYIFKQKEIE